jgi:hypothetical protein
MKFQPPLPVLWKLSGHRENHRSRFLQRHLAGDWGELDEHDTRENELKLQPGWRILSAYRLSTGVKFWIIMEADRSSTCFLLPEEY